MWLIDIGFSWHKYKKFLSQFTQTCYSSYTLSAPVLCNKIIRVACGCKRSNIVEIFFQPENIPIKMFVNVPLMQIIKTLTKTKTNIFHKKSVVTSFSITYWIGEGHRNWWKDSKLIVCSNRVNASNSSFDTFHCNTHGSIVQAF